MKNSVHNQRYLSNEGRSTHPLPFHQFLFPISMKALKSCNIHQSTHFFGSFVKLFPYVCIHLFTNLVINCENILRYYYVPSLEKNAGNKGQAVLVHCDHKYREEQLLHAVVNLCRDMDQVFGRDTCKDTSKDGM